MRQLELFPRPPINLLAKLKEESEAKRRVNYHFNGEAW